MYFIDDYRFLIENQTIQFLRVSGEEQEPPSASSVVEVIAPSVMMEMEKFFVKKPVRRVELGMNCLLLESVVITAGKKTVKIEARYRQEY